MDYSDAANEDFLYGLVVAGKTYFAARASGLYYSPDGQSWRLATETLDFQQAYSATAVAAIVTDTGTLSIFMGLAGGLLLSKDGGKSWKSANLPNPPPVISSLVISPNFWRDGVLLAGTLEDGVLRTADQGNNWHTWNFGLLDLSVMSLAISPRYYEDETVFAGTESGLFRSTNGGRAWREVESPLDLTR